MSKPSLRYTIVDWILCTATAIAVSWALALWAYAICCRMLFGFVPHG